MMVMSWRQERSAHLRIGLARASLVVASSCIAIVAVETAAWWLWGPPAVEFLSPPGRDVQTDFAVTYTVNSDGTRKTCPAPDSPRRRIVVLGDSFAFGVGVADGQDFAARLSCRMSDAAVMNLGAAAEGFLYYHLALQSLVPRDADDLILLIYENDLPPADWGGLLSNAKRVLYRWSWTGVLLRNIKQRVIARLFREDIESLTVDGRLNSAKAVAVLDPQFYEELTDPPADRLAAFDRALSEFIHDARLKAPSARLFVAFAPDPATISKRYRDFSRSLLADVPLPPAGRPSVLNRRAQEVCRRATGCTVIDLYPTLARAGGSAYFLHDPHWNARGHALVANVIFATLNRQPRAEPLGTSPSR